MSEWVELGSEEGKNFLIWVLTIIIVIGCLLLIVKKGFDETREHEVFQYKCNKEKGIYLKQYKGYVCVKQGEIVWKRTM